MRKEELNRKAYIAAWQIKEEIGLSEHSVERVTEIIAKQFGCMENAPVETVRHTNKKEL